MRKALLLAALVAAGCSKSSDSGTNPNKTLKDGVVLETDKTRLLFGQDFGNAILLGTQPLDTVQLISAGKQDLTISKVEIVSGTDADGGPLNDVGAFTATGPSATTLHGGETGFVQVVFKPDAPRTYGAILRITSNANPSTVDLILSGDCVTPLVDVLPLGTHATDFTAPSWTLVPRTDGGTNYAQGYSYVDVWFVDTGSAQLHFQPANFGDGGGDEWELCTPLDGSPGCQNGPLPNSLGRAYPDGGPSISGSADGGFRNAARLRVGFKPTVPGTFSTDVWVDSDATNTPAYHLVVHGTAAP